MFYKVAILVSPACKCKLWTGFRANETKSFGLLTKGGDSCERESS